MIYKRFYWHILLQTVLLAITPLLFWIAVDMPHLIVTTVMLAVAWCLQIIYLFYTINKTNRDLALFFDAFKYHDSSLVFNPQKKDKALEPLYESFNTIITAFGKVRIKREQDFEFFRQTVDLVGIGLLAFDTNGKILLQNKAFHQLFHVDEVIHLENLNVIEASFPELLQSLKAEKAAQLHQFLIGDRLLKVAVKLVEFTIEKEHIKLIAFQDVANVIAQDEMNAMHKLIRVFTHEIVNSVSPIAMLSGTLINSCDQPENSFANHEDIQIGLKAIRKRSKGLIAFVDQYKSLTHLPQPKFSKFKIARLLGDLEMFFRVECKQKHIQFRIEQYNENQELIADEKLMMQVLINLVQNAIAALENSTDKQIIITVDNANPVTKITVTDTGIGINSELLENIFTPFFTTKQNGSGIGLNLVQQIMRLHKGNVSVQSKEGNTTFELLF